jgi:rod shape determining protein RodA
MISAFLLVVLGLLSIYSICIGKGDFFLFKKQISFAIIGFILVLVFSYFDWRILRESPYLILVLYFLCLLALAGLFIFARHTAGWYRIGSFSFDPIEPTKIVLIILLAKYFSMRHVEMYRLKHIFLSGLYVFLPVFLIFLQPDLGSVLILIALWIVILAISGIKLRHFLILILLLAV